MEALINVLAEFELMGIAYEEVSENEVKIVCPLHADSSPSCCVNIEKRVFKCQSANCAKGGGIITLLAALLKTNRVAMIENLKQRYNFDTSTPISPALIEHYHTNLPNTPVLKNQLEIRGITDAIIRDYRIGSHDGRITIPISNEHGTFVNIRKYLPGAPGSKKFRNLKGCGQNRLFPVQQLSYDTILICSGEIKALAALFLLNRDHNIGAISTTAGEDSWLDSFTGKFQGKKVWVCYDIDKGGVSGANKLCARLKHTSRWIGLVNLPLDIDKYPKGDLSNLIGEEGYTGEMLKDLLESVTEWHQKVRENEKEEVQEVPLFECTSSKYTNKRVIVRGVVSMMNEAPYVIPKIVRTSCKKDQNGCNGCRIFPEVPDENGFIFGTIPSQSPAIIELVNTPKKYLREPLLAGLGISACKTVELHTVGFRNVADIRVSPQLEVTNRASDRALIQAFVVDSKVELNENYEFECRMVPHHKTQEAVLLASKCKPVEDALSTYSPNDESLSALQRFQPRDWSLVSLRQKLAELYRDLSFNVTHIYERQDLHLAVDLAYFSPLVLDFDSQIVKGWTEILIIGDSAQGKSETALRLRDHYRVGEKLECKNATVAGILGGLQRIGDRFMVAWGVIPTHDARIVILEELKGIETEVLAKLTDMRSSGIAEIPKIERRRTRARTRLLALSNPRSSYSLGSYSYGVDAIRELIGSPEDLRRFDAVFMAAAKDIDAEVINNLQRHRPEVEHTHTSELCHSLVLWAWTREKVVFDDKAYTEILDQSILLGSIFVDSIPIVDRGSMRFKLARLSAALAARTFSTDDESMSVLRVRKCHVEYIVETLVRHYSSSSFGYLHYSQAEQERNQILDAEKIRERITQSPFAKDFIAALLRTFSITTDDISDWCGYDQLESRDMVGFFVRKRALEKWKRVYKKTPAFIDLLRELNGTVENRPEYIEDDGKAKF